VSDLVLVGHQVCDGVGGDRCSQAVSGDAASPIPY
jgi:serine/threonine protein phosphatase PrpC